MIAVPPESSNTVQLRRQTGLRTSPRGSLPPQAEPLPCIPGYELLEEIGRGGMGIVYKARQEGLGRLVALKMVQAGRFARPEDRARFLVEAEMLARVQHPGIVQVHEIGEHEGRPYLAMEHVYGPSLSEQFADFQLVPMHADLMSKGDLRQRLDRLTLLVEQLARAVHAAHLQGVLHRDLKPGNILLARKSEIRNSKSETNPKSEQRKFPTAGQEVSDFGHSDLGFVSDFEFRISDLMPKVIDFGLAKCMHEAADLTTTGTAVGTPAYMAPEQAQGKKQLCAAVDIHALGVILYELLTGRVPFAGATSLELLRQVAEEEPLAPSVLQPALPHDLETICLKCLAKEPGRRYATALEVGEDLRRFREGEPVAARPAGRWERCWRWCRRKPLLAALTAGFVLVTLGGLTGMTILYLLADAAREQSEKERHCATNALRSAERNRQEAEAAAQEAREAQARFQAINDFLLLDLLAAGKPERLGPNANLKQAIDAAVPRIAAAFADRPLLEAAIRAKLGELYFQLTAYAQAEGQLRRAVELHREHRGPEHVDTLSVTNNLAAALWGQGHATEAGRLWAGLHAWHSDRLPANDRHLLALHNNLAQVKLAQGRTDEAEQILRDVLRHRRTATDGAELVQALVNLGSLLQQRGKHPEAETLLMEALQAAEQAGGAEHPLTLASRHSLALLRHSQHRHAEAEALFRQVLTGRRRVLGPHHAQTLATLNSLAALLTRLNRLDEAAPLLQEAWELRRRHLGPDHPDTLTTVSNHGALLLRQGKLAEAAALYRDALAAAVKAHGPTYPQALSLRASLAHTLLRLQQRPEAERLTREGVAHCVKAFGPDHERTTHLQSLLGYCLLAQQRFPEAEQLLRDCHARQKTPAALAQTSRRLAELYDRWGKPAEAAKWRKADASTDGPLPSAP